MAKLDFNSVMIGSAQPIVLADFYGSVFGRKADMDDGWWGWQVGSAWLSVGPHSGVEGTACEPQRLILNFETAEVKQEFERIKKLGTKVIKEPYQMQGVWIATFADPDGNYFQLMSPWEGTK